MATSKLISVIVPMYNSSITIENSLHSIMEQSYSNLEIILIDDCSTDNTVDICELYSKKDKRIRIIKNNENYGVAYGRNLGIKEAKGELIGFADSDDEISKDMYNILLENMEQYNADISVCDYTIEKIEEKDKKIKEKYLEGKKKHQYLCKNILTVNTVVVWNKLLKKELFNELIFPEKRRFEDTFLMPRIMVKAKSIVVTNEVLYQYNQTEQSLTRSGDWLRNLSEADIIRNNIEYFEKIREKEIALACKKVLISFYINNYYKLGKVEGYSEEKKHIRNESINLFDEIRDKIFFIKKYLYKIFIISPEVYEIIFKLKKQIFRGRK